MKGYQISVVGLPVAYWLKCMTGTRKVDGSNPGVVMIRSAELLSKASNPEFLQKGIVPCLV